MENKLLTIFNTYGKSNQVKKLLEEIGELIETIINEDKENMVKELADVMVMLEQFKLYYKITNEEITEIFWYKVDRQIGRIEKENIKKDEQCKK